jgi:diguanylate cyclase (GGDEF)-like protein/PAS domain S-box-containing protein
MKTILRRLRRARVPSYALASVLTMLTGLVVTALLYAGWRAAERERAHTEFFRAADVRFDAVARGFRQATAALQAINLLFVVAGEVSREQFAAFAQPLAREHGELKAVVFHRLVRADQRAAFEAARRREWPGFQITELGPDGVLVRASERPLYLVDDYVVPIAGNEITYGYDVYSTPWHRVFSERAVDLGKPQASGLVPLLQGGGHRLGVLIIMPVYRKGMPLTDIAARRRAALGDTEVVLDVEAVTRANLRAAGVLGQPGYGFTLAEANGLDGPVFRFGADGTEAAPWWRRWLQSEHFVAARMLNVAGRRWRMTLTDDVESLTGWLGSASILGLGVLLSLAGAGYVEARAQRTRRIEALVGQRTAQLKQASDALRVYQRAIESSANGIILVDATEPTCRIEYVNPAYERMRGTSAAQLIGHRLDELSADNPDQPAVAELRGAIRERRAGHALVRHEQPDGPPVYREVYIAPVNNPSGATEHFVISVYDVTTAKRYEAELERQSRYDSLTGLANRALLADRLEQALAFAAANGAPVWVVALDLDQFRFINDSLGHRFGDRLLQLLAPRIEAALPRAASVARTGGDEFVLVLADENEQRAAVTVRHVLDALSEPVTLEQQTLFVTGSAGVAAYPGDGRDAATLVKHAEIAMYRAKEGGRNAVQFFASAMMARALDRLELEGALRRALAQGQFELYYQPQVALASGDVVGTEALLRWRHPRLGTVGPARFIALAEETGLIVPIGAWVLRTACQQHSAWRRAGYGAVRMAVNLSARQFGSPNLAAQIAAVLAEAELDPACLEIEVTESLMMSDADAAIATMHELKAMGVQLSIDDFGTGYSSLSYLKRFPVDVLKIDRSFVHDLPAGPEETVMVDAIISLARGLRMRVIAEGVETCAQLEYLRCQGCDEVQGHVFSRALPAAELEGLLRGGRVAPAMM